MDKRKTQPRKKKKVRRDLTLINQIMAFFVLTANLFLVLAMIGLTQFSSLSRTLFIRLNLIVLIVALILNLLAILAVGRRSVSLLKTTMTAAIVIGLISAFGVYVEGRLNVNLDKMMNQGSVQETVGVSFVVLGDEEHAGLQSANDLNGKVFGILDDEQAQQGYQMPKNEIEKLKLKATYREYSDYTRLLKGLLNKEIDVAALPENYKGMFETNEEVADTLGTLRDVHHFNRMLTIKTEPGSDKDVTTEPFTVLIIGVDDDRSDALMLATVNPSSMTVLLTSIPRDSYLPMACYTNQKSDKINNSRVRGRQCTMDTVKQLLDVDIDFYFESNFHGIIEIVDALGGVIIDNPKEFVGQDSSDERGHQTVWVPQGVNRLNGEQTLAFARERHSYNSGDFQRQSNQQQVIQAILTEAVRLKDVNKALKVLDAAGENVSTNLSMEQMIGLFNLTMKKMDRSYVQNQNVFNLIGTRISGVNDRAPNRMSIVRLYQGSIEDNKKAIHRVFNQDSEINALKAISFSIDWVYEAPVISKEEYDEKFAPLK